MRWAAYRRKWGPLNYMVRNDRAAAMVAVSVGGGKLEDRMPWPIEEPLTLEEMEPATLDELAAAFGATPRKEKDDTIAQEAKAGPLPPKRRLPSPTAVAHLPLPKKRPVLQSPTVSKVSPLKKPT